MIIKEHNYTNNTTPLVSVSCLTYNHEKYIKDALESILMQDTIFPVEILVYDDASKDNTPNIIREYELKYPLIIKVIYQKENQWAIDVRNIEKIQRERAKGKYYAHCEGDDYWIAPLKLQKQVEFLESNPEYGLVHSNFRFRYDYDNHFEDNKLNDVTNIYKDLDNDEQFLSIINNIYKIRTCTAIHRTILFKFFPKNEIKFLYGDVPLWLDLSQYTKFKYLDEVFSVYRVLDESASKSKDKKKHYRFQLNIYEVRIYYCNKYGYSIPKKVKVNYNKMLLRYKIYDKDYKEIYSLFNPNVLQILSNKSKIKILKYIFFKINYNK